MVYPHVAILASTRIPETLRVYSNRVQRTEMAPHAADLVLEDFVVDAGLELALAGRRRGHVHGRLAAAEDDKGFDGRDGGAVEGRVADVGFEHFEGARVD